MIEEDDIQEHNGVYDGKWHIVSPEGFDLPEGLNYLKNMEFFPNIIISDMILDDATCALCTLADKYFSLTKRIWSNWNISILNCFRQKVNMDKNFKEVMESVGIVHLKIRGCQLTFADIRDVVTMLDSEYYHRIELSWNTFELASKNWSDLVKLASEIRRGYTYIKILDLSHNGFNESEKNRINAILESPSWLIL